VAILTPDQIKVQECGAAIQKVLNQYNCELQPIFQVINGQVSQSINIALKNVLTEDQEQAMREAMSQPGSTGIAGRS